MSEFEANNYLPSDSNLGYGNFSVDRIKCINLLLLGRSQCGKTTLVDTLLNPLNGTRKSTGFSESIKPECHTLFVTDKTNEQSYQFNIVDTPGLREMRELERNRSDEELLKLAINYVNQCMPCLNIVCFVSRAGDTHRLDIEAFNYAQKFLGISYSSKSIMVLTHCDQFSERKVSEFMESCRTHVVSKPLYDYCQLGIVPFGAIDLERFVDISQHFKYCGNERIHDMRDRFLNKVISIVKANTSYKFDFEEICSLGNGGFASVFKCKNKFDYKYYAIKKISFEPELRNSVSNELKFLSKLKSDYVVKYIYSWIEPNYYLSTTNGEITQNPDLNKILYLPTKTQLLHIQMELCSFTLRDVINQIKNECIIQNDNTISFVGYYISSVLLFETLECVHYLHSQTPAIIHRDIKPENILINFVNSRFVKLSDFGLSTFHEFAAQSHTKYKGTTGYKAPELSYTSKYSTKVDNYSLGITAQELFNIDLNDRKINNLKLLRPKINYIETLVEKLLSPVPDKRPNCEEILSENNLWRLSENELSTDKQLNDIISRSSKAFFIEENFIKFFVQKKYK